MSIPIVEGLLKTFTEGIRYLTLLSKTSHVRKLRKAIGYSQSYMKLTTLIENSKDLKMTRHFRKQRAAFKRKFEKLDQG